MINFLTQVYLSYRGLFLWLNWLAYISNILGRPVLFVVMFALVGRFIRDPEATQSYIIGMAAYSISVIILGGIIQSFYYERVLGTLSVLFASPGNRMTIYFSRAGLHIPNGLMTTGLSLLFGWLFLGLDVSRLNVPTMAVSILLITFAMAMFSLFLGSLAVVVRDWFYFLSGSQGLLIVVSGVIIPTSNLPAAVRIIGDILPLKNGLVALRAAFDGASIATVADALSRELAIGLAYAVLGFLFFKFLEGYAKRRGVLEEAI